MRPWSTTACEHHSRKRSSRCIWRSRSAKKRMAPSSGNPSGSSMSSAFEARSRSPSRRASRNSGVMGRSSITGQFARRDPLQELRERLQLVFGEEPGENLADVCNVRLPRLDQLLLALRRQHRVRDARVLGARPVRDVSGLLEPLQKPRDAGGRQEHALREVDALQRLLGRPRELREHVEVVDGQPVRGEQLGVELPRRDGMRPQEVGPRLQQNLLYLSYLTTQSFLLLSCLLNY